MSILNVNQIQPVGSGQTVTISASNITASSSTIAASSITVGNSAMHSTSIGIGNTTTAGRNAGVGTVTGTLIYNSTTNQLQYWAGQGWVSVSGTSDTVKATGGSSTYSYNGKTIHVFTGTDTFSTTSDWSSPESVEYVIIGGGGAGGEKDWRGGGGGAGAYKTGTFTIAAHPVATTITIGGGGAPQYPASPSSSGNGVDSSIVNPATTITAAGGGMGGAYSNIAGQPGGSGGGGGGGISAPVAGGTGSGDPFPGTIGATPSNGWGHDGGDTAINQDQGAGGGGAGAAGVPNAPATYPSTYGFGGAGVLIPTTFRDPQNYVGDSRNNWYVGGGGNGGGYPGGVNPLVRTTVPLGGGGFGGITYPPAEQGYDGQTNTGSGGGGASGTYNGNTSGNGGSGIVLIAYNQF